MKPLSIFLLLAGSYLIYHAWEMDITVEVKKPAYDYGINYTTTDRVVNLGLMNDRQNKLILGGIIALAGVVLFAASNKKQVETIEEPGSVFCPHCNTEMELDEDEIAAHKYICVSCAREVDFNIYSSAS